MPSPTKPCLACRQPIDAAATKCQHCQQIQTALAGLQNKSSAHYIALAAIIVVFGILLYSLFGSMRKPETIPSLTVGPASVAIGKPDEHLRASCFATITNPGLYAWGNLSLQAEFFDAEGKRLDVLYQEHRVRIYPTHSMSGRVSGQPNADPARYASCKISVINAS
ncbi:MAG: hypothetical protein H6R14_1405 [Proteobacteria bacterium]|nr:hypothetical protein [Pseudomonadota bacterium]